MKIADTVTLEKWDPLYKKSLLMAQKFGFFDFWKRKIHRVSHNGDLEYLLRAFVTDDAFWSYCCENYTENAEN